MPMKITVLQVCLGALALSVPWMSPGASAQITHPAELTNFKAKWDAAPFDGWVQLNFVGTVVNKSNTRIKGNICVALHDKDGFKIDNSESERVNIGINQSDTSTGYVRLKLKVALQAYSVKAYFAQFGCASSPDQAMTRVIELTALDQPNQ